MKLILFWSWKAHLFYSFIRIFRPFIYYTTTTVSKMALPAKMSLTGSDYEDVILLSFIINGAQFSWMTNSPQVAGYQYDVILVLRSYILFVLFHQ